MAKSGSNSVKKETMYIGIGVALVVGVLVGIVVSSFQSGSGLAPVQKAAGPSQGGSGGLTPQQASQIMDLEQRVASNPSDVDAWTQLGHVYFDTNRPNKAIRAYTKSLEIRPNDANVLTDLGVMYRKAGLFQEAISSFDKARSIDPRHEQSRFNKGIVLMYDLGNVNGAVAAWEDLLQVNPMAQTGNGIPITQLIDDAKAQATGGAQ